MAKPEKSLAIGGFRFDPEKAVLTGPKGANVSLRPQTAQVLATLAAAPGQLVTKESLMGAVWPDTHVTDDSLVQCISEIRRALGPGEARLLVTVPRQGYRLEAVAGGRGAEDTADRQSSPPRPMRRVVLAVAALVAVLVLSGGLAVHWLARGSSVAEPTRVAVLPFINMSGDPGQDYLAVGLAEDLLTDLARSRSLTVLSRSSTFGYRNSSDPAAGMHRALGATHLIDGSLQRDGDRIRISVQLVDAETGSSLWAERFDRRLEGLFDLQDEVRLKILEALNQEFQLEPGQSLQAGTSDVSAYDLLLQGRYLEASETRLNITRAIDLYKRAIDADPSYSDAYARLSNMYEISSRSGWSVSVEGDRALALEMAERAVRLDPDSPFAHWTKGRVVARLDRGEDAMTTSIAAFRTAIALDPRYADAYAYMALVYIGAGQAEEADAAIATAFDLNPEPQSWYYRNRGVIRFFEGDHGAAVEDLRKASDLNNLANSSRIWLAAALARDGQTEDAAWELEEALVNGRQNSVSAFLDWNDTLIRTAAFRDALAAGLKAAGMQD